MRGRGCEKTPQEDKKGFGARKRDKSFFVWYNLVEMKTTPRRYYTPRQGKIPVFVSDFLSISDPVLAFDRFMEGIDLSKYLKNIPEYITGRNRYNPVDMLKTVLSHLRRMDTARCGSWKTTARSTCATCI